MTRPSPQLLLLFLCLVLIALAEKPAAAQRPNFMLIVADDLCWRDLGFIGNKEIRTPNIDRLAQEGMSLSTMFTPATTCSPSRHALYTGLYCVRAGAYPNHTRVYEGVKSLFTYLKDAGYRVCLQNKTHVGPKSSFPYEHIPGADDLSKTKAFLTRQADQPWLLVFASNDPHSAWTRGPQYDPAEISIPPYLHDTGVTRKLLAAYYGEISKLDQQVGELMKLLEETRQTENTLVMFVSEQGSSFPYGGKWLMYDNGIRVAATIRWPGKIEPGSTTTALLQYVDVAPTFLEAAGIDPQKIDTGIADTHGDRGFDGRSFLGVLTGREKTFREVVFSQHTTVGINGFKQPYPMRAARDDRYKLIRNLASENRYDIAGIHRGQPIESWQADAKTDAKLAARVEWLFSRPAEELYDIENDPYELKNLAENPQYAEIKERLGKELDRWMEQQGDEGLKTELKAKSRQGR